jgi:RNA-directed DNA polymerase
VESAVTTTREPRDKLVVPAAAGANGPKDDALDWDAVDWRRVEGDVRRLRQRIFTASRNGCPALLPAREPSRLA